VRPLAQCATARGEKVVKRVKASWVTPKQSQNVRTENSPFALWVENTVAFRARAFAPFPVLVFEEAVSRALVRLGAIVFMLQSIGHSNKFGK
jgi:hypothetical protein